MGYFETGHEGVSPYMEELSAAKCVKRLANFVSGMQTCLDGKYDQEHFESLQADVAAVGQEFCATTDDMQQALQANEGQLLFGALVVDKEPED